MTSLCLTLALPPVAPRPTASLPRFPDVPGLVLRLEGDTISGLTTGSPVPLWPDASGNGHSATQITVAAQPELVTSGLNGRPMVVFDGVDDFMNLDSHSLTHAQIFAVLRCHSTAGNGIFGQRDAAVPQFLLNHYATGRLGYWNGAEEVWIATPSDLASQAVLITWTRIGGMPRIRLNGTQIGSTTEASPAPIVISDISGWTAPAPGVELSAAIIIDSDSTAATASVEHYLDQKYFAGTLGL